MLKSFIREKYIQVRGKENQEMIVCPDCGKKINRADVVVNNYICTSCGSYFRVRTKNRIRMVCDKNTFIPWFEEMDISNPLDFPGYEEKLKEVKEKTGLSEGVTVGQGEILGEKLCLGVCDSRFLMGSMGHAVGERIALAVERATNERLPVVIFCCSGGARMQEGIISLMQMAKTALVIGAETLSKMMDWNDRSTCILFGDGAGAAIVREDDNGIISMIQGTDGARGEVLTCHNRAVNNPFVKGDPKLDYTSMNGQEVYKFAVKTVPAVIHQALDGAGVEADEIKYFLLHQANIRIIEAVSKKMGQSIEKFPTNLQKCGNISAGSVPILLDFVNRQGMLQPGDKIVLAGFGAGLSWGAAVITW